jgi:hypothetical protein
VWLDEDGDECWVQLGDHVFMEVDADIYCLSVVPPYRHNIFCMLETFVQRGNFNMQRTLESDSDSLVRQLAADNKLALLVDAVELVSPLPGKWPPAQAAAATWLLQQLFGGIAIFKKAAPTRNDDY